MSLIAIMTTSDDGEAVATLLSWLRRYGSRALGKVTENSTVPITILVAIFLSLLVQYLATPRVDPREPPLLKPRIPLIGHIIGLLRYQADYHKILTRQRPNQPIATLQMLTGKMYALWDPILVSSGLRNKHLSSKPQVKAVAPILSVTSDSTTKLIRSNDKGDHLYDRIMEHAIPSAFKGDHLSTMTELALSNLSGHMCTLASAETHHQETIPNVWLWIRHLITDATTSAMYGKADPFGQDPNLQQALWDFSNDLVPLSTGILPRILAPVGNRSRALLFQYLTSYYSNKHDRDGSASAFVRNRAHEIREMGVSDRDVARIESLLPFVGTTNTVPTLFWLFSNLVSRPELVERLRGDIEKDLAVKREGDEVTLFVGVAVETKCPLLWNCYKETLRLACHQISTRTVLEDTVISDGEGRQYLLKKDCVVQMALGVGHSSTQYWGDDVDTFNPERFMSKISDGPGSAKSIRSAYQPFGGGLHLCPGRHFAVAEMMAVVATMVMGFEVEPLGGKEWKLPDYAHGSIIDAVTKPVKEGEGFGVRVRRRDGWEGVKWKYTF